MIKKKEKNTGIDNKVSLSIKDPQLIIGSH